MEVVEKTKNRKKTESGTGEGSSSTLSRQSKFVK